MITKQYLLPIIHEVVDKKFFLGHRKISVSLDDLYRGGIPHSLLSVHVKKAYWASDIVQ